MKPLTRITSALARRHIDGALDDLISEGYLTTLPNGHIVMTDKGRARLEQERRASYPPAFDPDAHGSDQLTLGEENAAGKGDPS